MFKKIIIRCDAAELKKIGTGHLYRSIILYKSLKKKFFLKKKDILFLIKTSTNYAIAKNILKKHNINFQSVKNNILDYSKKELEVINKFRSNLIIIDRWGTINKKFILSLRINHKKIVLIDDGSPYRKMVDLSINPLKVFCKKVRRNYLGYKYNILPILIKKIKIPKKIDNKTVFISFGGFDANNLTYKTVKYLASTCLDLKFKINKKYEKKLENIKNIYFYDPKYHYENLSKSNIVITAGGLSMFDAIYLKKKIICIPQHKHQIKNINVLNKKKVVHKVDINNFKKLYSIIKNLIRVKSSKITKAKQERIINYRLMQENLNLLYKCYEK